MSAINYSPPDRRRYPRTHLHMMLHGVRLDPDGGDVQNTLHMVDISRGGMGVVSDHWLYPGQRIVVSIPLHPEGGQNNLNATVVRCQKVEEGYRTGLEFDPSALGLTAYEAPAAMAA
ncbi:MAG: PilZ domain-containing protein [Planctomycetota bacterium]|nr:PilZ domain-containing protein [Planctomycetota bacterium]